MNVTTLLSTMVAAADVASGYVATPIGEKQWKRKTYYDLDGLAYGMQVQGERSFRRTERAAAELVALGFLRSVPWRVVTAAGIRSVPGAKFLTDKLWTTLGVLHLVRAERRRRDRERGHAKAAEIQRLVPRVQPKATTAPGAAVRSPAKGEPVPVSPGSQAPPDRGRSLAASAAIATLNDLFSKLDGTGQ